MTLAETRAQADLEKSQAELDKLQAAIQQRRSTYLVWHGMIPLPGKKILELPILDAFNSPRKIENLWSEGLEIDYRHRKVRRFDRCTTCHQGIDKTLAGTPHQPAIPGPQELTLVWDPSSASDEALKDAISMQPEEAWGIRLADEGLLASDELTVCYVHPQSPAAEARLAPASADQAPISGRQLRESLLQSPSSTTLAASPRLGTMIGDVILRVGGTKVQSRRELRARLAAAQEAGESLTLRVRRGLPHPFSTHPRLDLYVGSLSPHSKALFACSVCHEGQGSATSFKWASHAPNSEDQRRQWQWQYGWFDNEHWMYPMHPRRFTESACLKCHHDVAQLKPSSRFSEDPAPKLVHGYQLIRTFGCFGCHEINGYQAGRQVGPDARLEPDWHAVAMQLKNDPDLQNWTEAQRNWVDQLIQHPDRDDLRRRILELLEADATSGDPQLSHTTRTHLLPLLKDHEAPGSLRKRGPGLRYVAHKLTRDFLVDFVRLPQSFRPSSRMPRVFGLWDHLQSEGRAVAERFEPLEVLAISMYLEARSQDFRYLEPPQGIHASSRDDKIARGKVLFQERGCLACHTHDDFADAEAYRDPGGLLQGPDLTGLGPKLSHPAGRRWLYSWLQEPTRYHPRTLMPQTFLDPIPHDDGSRTDPADDLVEYLLAGSSDWRPTSNLPLERGQLTAEHLQTLDDLTRDGLQAAFSRLLAEEYAQRGIPAAYRDEVKGAEVELLAERNGNAETAPLSVRQKLMYVGRKSIARRGCSGCHDIPGMESTKTIGPALSDWGRKDEEQLAFESVLPYLQHGSGSLNDEVPPFYLHQIRSGHRAGFAYQKLREPRSYDYRRTENKRYSEWLRMPQFSFTPEEREAIITFVLGLVADPPTSRYVYAPEPHREAIITGEKLLEQYRCGACHLMEPQQWQLRFEPGEFGPPPRLEEQPFPFLREPLNEQQLAASTLRDDSGRLQATLRGMPALAEDGLPLVFYDFIPVEDDEELDPADEDFERDYLDYGFQLWQTAALEGETYGGGLKPSAVDASGIRSVTVVDRKATRGGFLSRYLLPHIVEREKRRNPNANGAEAWGWLPPPLVGQGAKVQSDWLHDFLLDPHLIRPSVAMRMPRFNLSAAEATGLARYFAAVDRADYPYQYQQRRQAAYLDRAEQRYRDLLESIAPSAKPSAASRFEHAMRIVTDNNYCIKCHIVGDFVPQTSDKAKAPDLSVVYRRLRPENVRRWIARPTSILPYTGMPVNIPYDSAAEFQGGVSQDLYHGTSTEQLDAVVDLLMNFDRYAKQKSSVAPLVQPALSE
jgi:mono/diheme cytochrome c family protein